MRALWLLFLAAPALADENIGDMTVGDVTAQYFQSENKNTLDAVLGMFVMGWIDGVRSIYVYEGVLAGEEYEKFVACTNELTIQQVVNNMLQVGAEDQFKEALVSEALWAYVQGQCEHVIGKSERPGDSL